MKQLIPMALGLALVTSQAQAASAYELSDMNDCELAGRMLQDTTPYLEKAMSLASSKDYKEVAEWRAKVFNPAMTKIETHYGVYDAATRYQDKPISREVSSEFVIRTKLFVQEVYNSVRNNGDKAGMTEQWKMMRVPVEKFSSECEGQSGTATGAE
ncbi:hypothetical protein I8D63_001759 [Vibrio parahaemolyticus]|uniref:hypothetical protein n=2 Tax=Vibrio harveyi group TaxID=717610 RepID=UPI0011241DD7|nr:hypothetical protein [Vibrio parahaemolyticus]EGR9012124.1 hypothetical protein [Vibrio parahaemolyticus]TOA13637.1 hypothetical protein CGK33_19070 [Vibrio parahaemolyticus]